MADPQLIYPYQLDAASGMVDAAYTRFTTFTNEAWNLATRTLNELADFTVPTVHFNAKFDPQLALTQFPTITAPLEPNLSYTPPPAPVAPPLIEAPNVQLSPAPVDNTVAPTYVTPAYPELVTIDAPGAAPTLAPITLPAAPSLTLPEAPADLLLNLPDVPTLVLPTFAGQRPVFDAPIPTEHFAFSPQAYVSDLLDRTRASITALQEGQGNLPPAVAKALRDRATLAVDESAEQAISEAYDQFGARGFCEPDGVLNRRLERIRTETLGKKAEASRDVFIQEQTTAIENLRFSITQGVALESALIQAHQEDQRLALEAAKYAVDVAISIFNARVAAFNAQVTAYQADAQVFRDLIAAEAAKLDLYKSQLEGEQIKAQISEIQLRRYEAQLRGVTTLVDVYKAQLDAVNVEVAINAQQLDVFRTRVSVMAEQVRAQATQIEGYSARVNAEKAKADLYKTATEGYAARVSAWSEGEKAKIDASRLGIESDRNRQEAWRATVELFTARLKGEQDRIDALVKKYGADADIFRSKATIATAASEANNRAFQLNLAEQQAVVDTELKRSELEMRQIDFIASITAEIKKAIASVAGQLTAASLSTVNFHAGTNYSGGMSLGYNLGINYSGSTD